MSTQTLFLKKLREELVERHPWAQDKGKLDKFVMDTAITMRTIDNKVLINGEAIIAAWRAIGMSGKPTYKGLRDLPHGIDWIDWATREGAEVIEGLGQFKAGHGAYVTDWCETREEACRAFCILKHGRLEPASIH